MIRWTPDGRHLVFSGSLVAERWGTFSMPSLGGEPRFLGCCNFSMGDGDTVLVTTSRGCGHRRLGPLDHGTRWRGA